ncbi:MAG: hypothetical protein ACM3PP_08860 [Candidatus Saccharibacteria bacterium]
MFGNNDLDEALRQARLEIDPGPGFNKQVMRAIASLEKPSVSVFDYVQQVRVAGVSLVLAGVMLMMLNTTTLGQNVDSLTSSVKNATSKVGKYEFKIPSVQSLWQDVYKEKRVK